VLALVLLAVGLAGLVVLAGAVALLLVGGIGASALLTWGAVRVVRLRRSRAARPGGPSPARRPAHWSARHAAHPSVRAALLAQPPLQDLTLAELGREWQRTAAALESTTDPATREVLVRRRREALDELERRDPAGFTRWLTGGSTVDGDPARHLRGDRSGGPGTG
jgi:hypothetical protein